MYRIVFASICILLSGKATGQDTTTAKVRTVPPRHAVKISPVHLLSFYPTIQVAYEVRLRRAWTVQFDAGYVFDLGADDNYQDRKGYKVKVEPHYYFFTKRTFGFYGALEVYRNRVNFERTSTQTECFDGDCENRFSRTYTYPAKYREHGLAIKAGFVKYFGNFLIDGNAGLGVRIINYTFPSYITKNVEYEEDEWIVIPRIDDRTVVTPVVNFRLGYRIQ